MGGDGIHAKTSSTSDPPVIIVNSRRLKFCTKKRANISQFMKNREILPKIIIKWLLILLLIISMVSPIFYYIYVEKTQSNPQEIIFVYDVVATTTSNKYRIGNYKIRYLPKENLVIEIKDYTIPIQTPNSSANVNVINTKTYHYSQDAKLEQYNEIETLDSRKKFEKNVSIDYDLPSGQIIVHFSENLSPTETFTLEDNLPYTINSSFVLSMGLRENPSFDSSWLCYEGQGYIDSYEYLDQQDGYLLLHSLASIRVEYVQFLRMNFPNMNIIIAHMGRNGENHFSYMHNILTTFKDDEHIYFDTSTISDIAQLQYGINLIGCDRILWGSDFPYDCRAYSPFYFYGNLYRLDLLSSELEKILYKNALRIALKRSS